MDYPQDRESAQIKVRNELCIEVEKVSVARPPNQRGSTLNLHLFPTSFLFKGTGYFGISAKASIDKDTMQDRFVEWDPNSKAEPELVFRDLKPKEFQTLSVAEWVYSTDRDGNKSFKVSMCLRPMAELCQAKC